MESNDNKVTDENYSKENTNLSNGIAKPINVSLLNNLQNTTVLEIIDGNILCFDEITTLPPSLTTLKISRNKLIEIPKVVLKHENLKVLDVSHNKIVYFNDTPSFCNTIEQLNIANNCLNGPPQWIWTECPKKLIELDISSNVNLTNSFEDGYLYKLSQLNTLITSVKLFNCKLGKHLQFLGTFKKVKELVVGTSELNYYAANQLLDVPCQGLDRCCDIERLNLTNSHIYNVHPNINMYKRLIEINLSQNNLTGLPDEFCLLENLEICILSFNNILYLPDGMVKLTKLTKLCLDVNELCMLPVNICDLKNLKTLDIYDNNIYEVPDAIINIEELDLAQNFFDEPNDAKYMEGRVKLRLKTQDRICGRKEEITRPESEHSSDTTDDEEYLHSIEINRAKEYTTNNELSSSPEDWDSDSHWEPHFTNYVPPSPRRKWLSFVKQKMEDGNLCPMDMHPVSVMDKVKYERLCYPQDQYESEGQFDDFSGDDS